MRPRRYARNLRARSKWDRAANATQGPPPPRVPEGWKAVWNDQYSEWFFVNVYTKRSQWDKPTEPAYPPGEGPPDHPPPSYIPGGPGAVDSNVTGTSEKSTFSSNNPYAGHLGANIPEDEKLARKLQEEEEARARSHGPGAGASNDYYSQPGQAQQGQGQYGGYPSQSASPYAQAQSPYDGQTQDKGKSKGGLLGKLLGKASGHGSSGSSQAYPQQSHYGQPGYGAQPGYAPQAGYYQQPGRPMMGGMGGMGGGRRPGGGGMGAGGMVAAGGAGLLGGALLGSA
ncbi:MAG: hypothetical protein EOO38_32335, partial [Cytophagaceae bacterium]